MMQFSGYKTCSYSPRLCKIDSYLCEVVTLSFKLIQLIINYIFKVYQHQQPSLLPQHCQAAQESKVGAETYQHHEKVWKSDCQDDGDRSMVDHSSLLSSSSSHLPGAETSSGGVLSVHNLGILREPGHQEHHSGWATTTFTNILIRKLPSK